MTRLGVVSERDLADMAARVAGLQQARPQDFPPLALLENRLSANFLLECRALPLDVADQGLVVALADPFDQSTLRALAFAVGTTVRPMVACSSDIEAVWTRLYGQPEAETATVETELRADDAEDVERLLDIASEAPVIRIVNRLISEAVLSRASDIHLEPTPGEVRVRYRIDGLLREMEPLSTSLKAAVVSRVKILAKLNIAERRLAQDGRIRLAVRGKEVDLRVSTTPTLFGESVVLRILDRDHLPLDFAALGFDNEVLAAFDAVLDQPHGILLVTGPTGSGKTTTLYTSLVQLNTPERKILSIEDPVEYQIPGVNQVQVKPQIGLTFASALRSFLRQDPDIILIGEIRDVETAQIAVQAALTGHLILSTLHTNDAASAVTRLLDMGVEDYLLTSTLNGLVSQRLVRRLCPHCREPSRLLPGAAERLGLLSGSGEMNVWRARGCPECRGTGYCGRTSIIEVLPVTDAIRKLILTHAEASQIRRAAIAQGMQTMSAHGLIKALAGETSVEEVLRVTREE
jgi:general secretion pathway protein E